MFMFDNDMVLCYEQHKDVFLIFFSFLFEHFPSFEFYFR